MILSGRTYLITGAQQGIGAAIALRLAGSGANVAINYLDDQAAAEGVAEAARQLGGNAITVKADVAAADEVEAMVSATMARFGTIDGLVNNAGIFPRHGLLEISEDEWDRVMGINLKGVFLASRAAVRQMIAQARGGNIINLSSAAANGAPGGSHYSASKGGIVSLTRSLALELAPHRIRVNAIAPGLIDTAQPRGNWSADQIESIGRRTPLGRVGTVDDVAACAAYLASDAADYVTGQTLHVNGGVF